VCRDAAKSYLSFVNALVILLGLAVTAVGGYLIAQFKETIENQFGDLAVFLPVITGVVIMFVGMLGCYGASNHSKCALLVYWVIMTAVTIIVLGLGIAFLIQVGLLDDVKLGESEALVDEGQKKISDSIFAVYETCCVDGGLGGSDLLLCDDDASNSPCVFDREFVDSVLVGDELCTFLESVDVNVNGENVKVVGEEQCEDASLFKEFVVNTLEDNILPIGIALIVLSVLLMLVEIFTCCLICSNREDFDEEYRIKAQTA